jgi:tRNA(fMet)-specific endonuclease VapC
MSSVYLLDTSVIVDLFRSDSSIVARLQGKSVLLCSPVMGELYFGALKSAQPAIQRKKIDTFASAIPMFAIDKKTADQYAAIKFALQQKGKPIPENDMWIAAVAIQQGLTLATRDKHFSEISNLSLEVW